MNNNEQWTAAQYQERMQKLEMSKRHAGKYKQESANALTRSIMQWLNWNGFSVWRNNTMGVFDPKATAKKILELVKVCIRLKRIPTFSEITKLFVYRKSHERKGVADVIGFEKKSGRFVAVEVKHGKDVLSTEQLQFLEEVRKNNGISIVAHDMSDFLKKIEQFF